MTELDNTQRLYYYLLGKALLGDQCTLETPPTVSDAEWERLFQLAAKHQTAPLVYDALLSLQQHFTPHNRKKFMAESILCENACEHQNQLLLKILKTINGIGGQAVLLKGADYARHYPNPAHRQYSDIDIFIIGDEAEFMRRAAEELDARNIRLDDRHHAKFTMDGILIECHRDLISWLYYQKIDSELADMMGNSLENRKFRGEPILLPLPTMSTTYLVAHAFIHSLASHALRAKSLCDLVAILKDCRSDIDEMQVRQCLARSDMEWMLDNMCYIAVKYMGMPPDWLPARKPLNADLLATTISHPISTRPAWVDNILNRIRKSRNYINLLCYITADLANFWRFLHHFDHSQSLLRYITSNLLKHAKHKFETKKHKSLEH